MNYILTKYSSGYYQFKNYNTSGNYRSGRTIENAYSAILNGGNYMTPFGTAELSIPCKSLTDLQEHYPELFL